MNAVLSKVSATERARDLVQSLVRAHGPLIFHQSGGCCDGSAPMCYPRGDFLIGARDVLLGSIEGCEYYIGGDQWERWQHTRLVLDVVPGRGAGFSLEAPEGVRFIIRSELCEAP
ncbi:MAG TPA: DUF779 domain-containing protein [Polyangiaceae bacterium]|nr:DUF779 domain-containing protein [Polyangiaceae bacterium]